MKISSYCAHREPVWPSRVFCHFSGEMATPAFDGARRSISRPLACVWGEGFLRLFPIGSRDNV